MSFGCISEDDLSFKKQCVALASIFVLFTYSIVDNAYTAECIFNSIGRQRLSTDLPVYDLTDLKAALNNTKLREVLSALSSYEFEFPVDRRCASLDTGITNGHKISFPAGPSIYSTDNNKRSRSSGIIPIVSRHELAYNMCGLGKQMTI